MKKKNLKFLKLNKKSISTFNSTSISGGEISHICAPSVTCETKDLGCSNHMCDSRLGGACGSKFYQCQIGRNF